MFVKGLAYGLAATALNFTLLWLAVRQIVGRRPGWARVVMSVAYVVRYAIFAGLLILFLRFRFGSTIGLLVGVTLGIGGFLVWQGVYAAHRRGDRVQS